MVAGLDEVQLPSYCNVKFMFEKQKLQHRRYIRELAGRIVIEENQWEEVDPTVDELARHQKLVDLIIHQDINATLFGKEEQGPVEYDDDDAKAGVVECDFVYDFCCYCYQKTVIMRGGEDHPLHEEDDFGDMPGLADQCEGVLD